MRLPRFALERRRGGEVMVNVAEAVGQALFVGGLLWLAYMALEPHVRRHWPAILVGWSRVLAGRWRDPRVGRDVLAGAAVGTAISLLACLDWIVPAWLGGPEPRPGRNTLEMLLGGAQFAAYSTGSVLVAVLNAMALVALIFIVLFVVRKRWIAGGVIWIVLTALTTLAGGADLPALDAAIFGLVVAALLGLIFRFGLLSLIVAYFFLIQGFPLSLNLSAWYGNSALVSLR